jgi:uncharacterized protein YndB with AHSA1/START domain
MLAPMHTIVHELTIAAAPEVVFDAVTTAAGLGAWWSSSVDTDATDGAEVSVSGPRDLRLRVDTFDRPELVHFDVLDGPEEWTGTQIALRIEPTPDGTGSVMRLWHGGWEYDDGELPRASFNWALELNSLRASLES